MFLQQSLTTSPSPFAYYFFYGNYEKKGVFMNSEIKILYNNIKDRNPSPVFYTSISVYNFDICYIVNTICPPILIVVLSISQFSVKLELID